MLVVEPQAGRAIFHGASKWHVKFKSGSALEQRKKDKKLILQMNRLKWFHEIVIMLVLEV